MELGGNDTGSVPDTSLGGRAASEASFETDCGQASSANNEETWIARNKEIEKGDDNDGIASDSDDTDIVDSHDSPPNEVVQHEQKRRKSSHDFQRRCNYRGTIRQDGLRPGPTNPKECLDWATSDLKVLYTYFPARYKALIDALIRGIYVYSDYSALGTWEDCCRIIMRVVVADLIARGFHKEAEALVGLVVVRCCDNAKECQKVLTLLAHENPDGKKPCLFADILDRIPLVKKHEMMEVQRQHVAAMEAKQEKQDGKHKAKYDKADVHKMLLAMQKVIEYDNFSETQSLWCLMHDCICRLNKKVPEGALSLAMGGNACQDWASLGQKKGWTGSNAAVFVVWVTHMKSQKHHLIIEECTRQFDWQAYKLLLGDDYTLSQRICCPTERGQPARRERFLSIAARTESCTEQGLRDLDLSGPDYLDIFGRTLQLDGRNYFTAPEEARANHLRYVANLQFYANATYTVMQAINVGYKKRLVHYKNKIEAMTMHPAADGKDVHLCNIEQDQAHLCDIGQDVQTQFEVFRVLSYQSFESLSFVSLESLSCSKF